LAGSFIPLGELPGGDIENYASGVSDDGRVVVGSSRITSFAFRAFRWTFEEGMQDLGTLLPADSRSFASGISGDGRVILGSSGTTARSAFRWTQATGPVPLPDIPGGDQNPLGTANEAIAATPDGSIVVGRSGAMGALWPEAGGVMELAANFSHANAISADGSTVVGWTSGSGWRKLGADPIELLPLRIATDVSSDGAVIVGRCNTFPCSDQAALWSDASGRVPAGPLRPDDTFSQFEAVSGDGAVAVGFSGTNSSVFEGNVAIVWDDASGLRSLEEALADDYGIDVGDWTLVAARAISSDGQAIAGAARSPEGRIEGFLALLRPQCSDGIDNDLDGDTDLDDSACDAPERDSETELIEVVPSAGPWLRFSWRAPPPSSHAPHAPGPRLSSLVVVPAAELVGHDPREEPTALLLRDAGGDAGTGPLELDPTRWRPFGGGFFYSDPAGASGPVSTLWAFPNGHVFLVAGGPGFPWIPEGPLEGVEVQLRIGDDVFCARFAEDTGAKIHSRRRALSARGANAPESCELGF
jgi:probable HAF family extracellular repeat protein